MKLQFSLPVITSVIAAEASQRAISTDGAEFSSKIFDYIVIGGGTVGLTLAARLSENSNTTIGVIESGEYFPDDSLINTPSSAFLVPGNAKYDWLFKSVPQAKVNNRVFDLPRGKVLGGSSAINGMVFDRASKVEYEAWAKLGNPGWDWEGLLPSMRAAEHFTSADPFRINYTDADPDSIFPSQGKNGPIAASYNNWYGDMTLPFWRSMTNLGVPSNFDPDSGNTFGIFNTASSVNRTTGRRSYSATTYYAYNAHRTNLIVLTGAHATKINFKDALGREKCENLVATGVSFVHKSQKYTVKVKKEIVLSAGKCTFQSPHLLELSGIGNSDILQKHGIKPVIDLPGVGENYQDHLLLTAAYELKPGSSAQGFDDLRNNATFAAAAVAQYNATHDGILSYPAGSVISFLDLDFIAGASEISRMIAQLDREIASEKTAPLQKVSYDIQKKWLTRKKNVGWIEVAMYPGYIGAGVPKANTSYITIFSFMEHPFSRGSIHVNTSDPLIAPKIDPNYFSKTIDLETLVHSVRFIQKLAKTQPLASTLAFRQGTVHEAASAGVIADYVKANVVSSHHPIGTTALAPKELGGVVDVHLKVYGTANVRVVDASIIPLHIGTHIQRTVYGIAEKAAKIIKRGF